MRRGADGNRGMMVTWGNVAGGDPTKRRLAVADDATVERGVPPREAAAIGRARLERGTSIGRYIVLETIGEGGMGTVAAAYDPELDRKVALKLVHAEGDADGGARLLREARALAKLRHPNVVAVHDVGESDDGVYLAMELVEGTVLAAWMRTRPRWREVLRVFVEAGRGLAAAHAAGLVHRDFKPANVVIGVDGRVRVLDFGLARSARSFDAAARPGAGVDVVVTDGELVGTPAYMAPEQHDGGAIDARADEWAFCVALHEALWGVRPFLGNDAEQIHRAASRGQIVATASGDVPPTLRRAIVRGLSAAPTDRFASMDELLAILQRLHRRRPRRLAALAAAVILGAGAASIAFAFRDHRHSAEAWLDEAGDAARAAAAQAYFVYPPADDPSRDTALGHVLVLERRDDARAGALATALREEFAATLVRLGDRYWDADGGRPFAIDYYVQALVFRPDPHARERARVTPGELVAVRQQAEDRDFSAAQLEAAEVLVVLAEPDPSVRDEAMRRHRARGRTHGATTEAALDALVPASTPRAAAPKRPAPPIAAPIVPPPPVAAAPIVPTAAPVRPTPPRGAADALVQEARVLAKAGKAAEAERAFHRALASDPDHVGALAGLADLHFDRGAYPKAVDFGRRAVTLAPKRAALRIALGDALFKVSRFTEARAQYQQADALGAAAAKARIAQVDAKLAK